MPQRIWRRGIQTFMLLLLSSSALAAPLLDSQIPEPLKAWKDWVLFGHEDRLCPGTAEDNRYCVWPSTLRLDLHDGGGRFSLSARLYAPGWLPLPGEENHWPQDVSANGRATPVMAHEGWPALYLPAGEHRIEGQFLWKQLPESLPVPADSGLLMLSVNGNSRAPQLDSQQRLALGQSTVRAAPQDHVALKVYRKITDGIPLTLTTHLELQVSGRPREATLAPFLPPGFLPLSMSGNLPARMDAEGRLHLQLRPGLWALDVDARATASVARLALPALPAPWPSEEVWSFQTHPELRVVDVDGAPGMDPRQTQMPEDWRTLPAYLLGAGTALNLTEKQRGATIPETDQLQLERQLWLDGDGRGYTVQDQLSGQLRSHWRLEAEAPVNLGQVIINGEPQLITRNGKTSGIEVRNSELLLLADSRIDQDARQLPVSAWNVDLQRVHLQLHLPPAWRLLAAPGTDNVPDSWLSRWTLLDLFVVLIASVAALRLFGPAVAALTLLTLVLTWQEPGAPRWLWINLIIVIALAHALPGSLRDSRLAAWLERYRWLAALLLMLAATPFSIQQVRVALYPQLEAEGNGRMTSLFAAKEEEVVAAEAPAAEDSLSSAPNLADKAVRAASRVQEKTLQKLDPSIITQTGPGLPQWSGHTVALDWTGTVSAGQSYRLWLQPPWLTRSLELIGVLLMAALLVCWMDLRPGRLKLLSWRRTAAGVLPLMTAVLLFSYAPRSEADDAIQAVPTPSLLESLRERLLAAPACRPDCLALPRLRLAITGDRLTLRLTVDAETTSALPLPLPSREGNDQARGWQAETILLDGKPASLRRDNDGSLWASVPAGRHEILASGSLRGQSQIQLPLPLKPHLVVADTGGWLLGGMDELGRPGTTLQLSAPVEHQSTAGRELTQQAALSPLLRITRRISLGLDWEVDTVVERVGANQAAALYSLPLLAGEAVTGEGVHVVGNAVQAGFTPGQTQFRWTSRLAATPQLKLMASPGHEAYEVWDFHTGPLWHVDFKGLPPVQQVQDGAWVPRFQPWPGETLQVAVSRPGGAPGRTLTLDRTELSLQPTTRATETTLTLTLRSSQGGQHRLRLPPQTTVAGLMVNGVANTPRLENGNLVLPLQPGAQTVALQLRSHQGLQILQRSPAIDLGLPGVNADLTFTLPEDRWVLLLGGPQQGPAVLFWGVLLVLFAIAFALGRVPLTPLRGRDWALLMVGLSQLPVAAAAVVVIWLIALGARGRVGEHWAARRFNLMQVGLVILSALALGLLFGAIAQGLLGRPDMQVTGNGSSAYHLHWFQDRHEQTLPQAWVLSVSIWFYRLLMLLWALWLANALLGWLRWGWAQFTTRGLWLRTPVIVRPHAPGSERPSAEKPEASGESQGV